MPHPVGSRSMRSHNNQPGFSQNHPTPEQPHTSPPPHTTRSHHLIETSRFLLNESAQSAPAPSLPAALIIERRQVARGESFIQLKVAHARHRLLHPASPIVASSCTLVITRRCPRCPVVGHSATTRPLRFVAISIARCVLFLALVDRHLREQLLPCQGCAGFEERCW